MEQVTGSKPTPKMIFKNQKEFSEKVHKRTLKAIKEVLKCCDTFEVKDDQTETFLFTQVNHYYWDLTNVIFNLHQILIDIGKNISTANHLQNILDEFHTLMSSIQESLKLEAKKLTAKLKANIVGVGFQVEKLLKIIELDDSHEFKQRILDCQLDLVIYTEKLKIGMQSCDVGLVEIVKHALEHNATLVSTLIQLKSSHQVVEDDFSHYVRKNVQHARYIVDYMLQLRNSGRFTGNLNENFKKSEKMIEAFLDEMLYALESDDPIKKFIDCMEKCYNVIKTVTDELQKGISDAVQQDIDKKVQNIIQELILYIFICGLNTMHSLNRTVEDVFVQN